MKVEEIKKRVEESVRGGGGGTVIIPALEHAVKHYSEIVKRDRSRLAGLVILTDGLIAEIPAGELFAKVRQLFKVVLEVYTIEKSYLPFPGVPYTSLQQ